MDITLVVLLQKPVMGIDYAIQKGTGNDYEAVQIQQSGGKDLSFRLTIQLRDDPKKENAPRFKGPFVQGKPLDQFFYIDVGKYAGQTAEWGGRIKVPLTGISWAMIARLGRQVEGKLAATVPGTKDGKPLFATVRNFGGWAVEKLS